MVLRGKPVGEQDVADQRRAFRWDSRKRSSYEDDVKHGIPAAMRPGGAYSYSSRGGDATRRTLKTGYCDR